MFDPNKPVITVGKMPARIICTDKNGEFPIIALVTAFNGEIIKSYTKEGVCFGSIRSFDLVNVKEVTKRGFANIYSDGRRSSFHGSRLLADGYAVRDTGRIAVVEIVTYSDHSVETVVHDVR